MHQQFLDVSLRAMHIYNKHGSPWLSYDWACHSSDKSALKGASDTVVTSMQNFVSRPSYILPLKAFDPFYKCYVSPLKGSLLPLTRALVTTEGPKSHSSNITNEKKREKKNQHKTISNHLNKLGDQANLGVPQKPKRSNSPQWK